MVRSGRAIQSPLETQNAKAARKRERRILLPEEWEWLQTTTEGGPERFGMTGRERVLLYAVAIQTGLRVSELRALTRGRLFLDEDSPYVIAKAGTTKNKKTARQHINPDLAEALKLHAATKAPQAPVFSMPNKDRTAAMLREDLDDTRTAWLKAAQHNTEEYARREQSDFLKEANHDGEVLDFHSLRHTCGAWLAMTGAHPKAVQSVMRHSSITLTMDTYGHMFPGQEAETVARLPRMMNRPVRATGTAETGDIPKTTAKSVRQIVRNSRVSPRTTTDTTENDEAEDDDDAKNRTPAKPGVYLGFAG